MSCHVVITDSELITKNDLAYDHLDNILQTAAFIVCYIINHVML